MDEIEKLQRGMFLVEGQRSAWGTEIVDSLLDPIAERLSSRKAKLRETEAHRREYVAVLFVDIVGSTRLTFEMDIEDGQELVDACLRRLKGAILGKGGKVVRYQGDGLKAVFGLPAAREDDVERAVEAGLAILEVAKGYAEELRASRGLEGFALRVGVAAGPVVVGGGVEADSAVDGPAVNLAARLEGMAPPGGLLISYEAYLHVRGAFELVALEPVAVKGIAEPVRSYLVSRLSGGKRRRLLRGVEGTRPPMVGREAELGSLEEALASCAGGRRPSLALVRGEAGMGKTRLLDELVARARSRWEMEPFEASCPESGRYAPFGLIKGLLASRYGIGEDESAAAARRKFEDGVGTALGGEAGLAESHFLGYLLGYPFADSPYLQSCLEDPRQLRDRGLEYLCRFFRAVAPQGGLVLVRIEDLQWADEESLGALRRLVEAGADLPIAIVASSREGCPASLAVPLWGGGLPLELVLSPLGSAESALLLDGLLAKAPAFPPALRERILLAAGGNPYFVEEFIQMLIDQGVIRPGQGEWTVREPVLADIGQPGTLTELIQGRLDCLPKGEREALRRAAVVGRVFWDGALARLAPQGGDAVEALPALMAREMIFLSPESSFAVLREYLFKHETLRAVTYATILKATRQEYHGLVARWLVEVAGERAEEFDGAIAEHYELAGEVGLALPHALRALGRYKRRFLNSAIIGLAERMLPHAAGRDRVAFLLAEADARLSVSDFAGGESLAREAARTAGAEDTQVEEADILIMRTLQRRGESRALLAFAEEREARILDSADPNRRASFLNLYGLAYAALGKPREAEALYLRASEVEGASALSRAHSLNNIGNALNSQGRREEALDCLRLAKAQYEADGNPRHIGVVIANIGVILDFLVRREEAEASYMEALSFSTMAQDSYQRASIFSNLAIIHFDLGDAERASGYERSALSIRRSIDDKYGIAISRINSSDIELWEGRLGSAREGYAEAARILEEIGGLDIIGYALLPLADIAAREGDPDESLRLLERYFALRGESPLDAPASLALALAADCLESGGPGRRLPDSLLAALAREGIAPEGEPLYAAAIRLAEGSGDDAFRVWDRRIARLEGLGGGAEAAQARESLRAAALASGKPRLIRAAQG